MRRSLLSTESDFVGFGMAKKEGLSADYAKRFLAAFKDRLASDFDKQSNFMGTCCAVIYRRFNDGRDAAFENMFFPAILPVPIDWQPGGGTRDEQRVAEKELFDLLVRTTKRTRTILEVLHRELREQANTTPLLLPVRNFDSADFFGGWLRALQADIVGAADEALAGEILSAARNEFETRYPRKRGSGHLLSFHDDREIEFRAPGVRRMHGRPWLADGHASEMCHLSGFRRLGAPFNAAFHYDAQKDSPRKLTSYFCQCHGDYEKMTGEPHLNIAPNDFIRV
jgi:hypothetical protein